MKDARISLPDRHGNLVAMPNSLDVKGERTVEAVRAITTLPATRTSESGGSRLSETLEALALEPDFEALTIRACCPARGEPFQFSVGQRRKTSHSSDSDEELAGCRIDALVAYLWPDAAFVAAVASPPNLPFSVAIRPAVEQVRPIGLPKPRVPRWELGQEMVLTGRPARRRFDLLAALAALALHAPSELVIEVSPFALDARHLRALEVVEQRQHASAFRGDVMPDESALALVKALRAIGAGVRIEVLVRVAQDRDPFVSDLVSLALYGSPTDRNPGNALDLRSVWPLGASLPRLLPSETDSRRITERARSAISCPNPTSGSIVLGRPNAVQEIAISARDRARHLYCLGSTGTGKSTLLLNLLVQDMRNGEGVILIDPHGDLADAARELVPPERSQDLIWSDLSDPKSILGMNILEGQGAMPELERNYICNELISLFKNVLYRNVPEAFGPMFETYFRNGLMLLMGGGGPDVNLMDFERVFHDTQYRNQLIKKCPDRKVCEFWQDVADKVSYSEITLENVTPYIVCKLTQLTGNPLVRRVIDVRNSQLDLRVAVENNGIVLIKLAKGLIGDYDTSLIATLLTIRIAQIGMARAALRPEQRRSVRLYIDEFQNCAGEALSAMLAETRKYGISLTLANQSLSQIDGRGTHNDAGRAALANVANLVVCRVGAPDAARLAPWFEPHISWQELCRLPDFHAAVRVLDNGRPAAVRTIQLAAPPYRA